MTLLLCEIAAAAFAYRLHEEEKGWLVIAGWIAVSQVVLAAVFRKKLAAEWASFRATPRAWLVSFWKNWGEPFVVALALALIIRTFFLGPYKIPSESMVPTFLKQDRIFVDKVSYRFHPPERGDIVVFKYPKDRKKDYVKRLAGLPGDKIEIREGQLIVNGQVMQLSPFSRFYYYNQDGWPYGRRGQVVTVPDANFFVLGDNSAHSSDSRDWGFVPARNVVGKAFCIWWPPRRVKLVK